MSECVAHPMALKGTEDERLAMTTRESHKGMSMCTSHTLHPRNPEGSCTHCAHLAKTSRDSQRGMKVEMKAATRPQMMDRTTQK